MPVKTFNRDYVSAELEKLGSCLKRKVNAFLIGGCSMAFRGLKDATKDVDMVFTSPEDIRDVIRALGSLGYSEVKKLPKEYKELGASAVMRNEDGSQIDLFLRQVCRGLEITDTMENRAILLKRHGNLEVYLMAPEDIFLFKSITEREADLLDMRTLAETGLAWDVIKEECRLQGKRKLWEAFLLERLLELKEKYGIEAPIIRELYKTAGDELVKRLIIQVINEGNDTFDSISAAVKERSGYSESWTRRALKMLVNSGVIKAGRSGRKYTYGVK